MLACITYVYTISNTYVTLNAMCPIHQTHPQSNRIPISLNHHLEGYQNNTVAKLYN